MNTTPDKHEDSPVINAKSGVKDVAEATSISEEIRLPLSIKSVWEHPLVKKATIEIPQADNSLKKKETWQCLVRNCGQAWNGANHTKVLAHGSRDVFFCAANHTKPCTGDATKAEIKLFVDLLQSKQEKNLGQQARGIGNIRRYRSISGGYS